MSTDLLARLNDEMTVALLAKAREKQLKKDAPHSENGQPQAPQEADNTSCPNAGNTTVQAGEAKHWI